MKKKNPPKRVFWFYTKGMLIFFASILIIIIIALLTEVYMVSCLGLFIFVIGNTTLVFSEMIDRKEDYARRDGNNGSDIIGNYDGPKDQYLDRF